MPLADELDRGPAAKHDLEGVLCLQRQEQQITQGPRLRKGANQLSWRLEPFAYIVVAFDTSIVARATFPDVREDVHAHVVLYQLPQRVHRLGARRALVTYNVAYGVTAHGPLLVAYAVTAHGPLLVACLGVHGVGEVG